MIKSYLKILRILFCALGVLCFSTQGMATDVTIKENSKEYFVYLKSDEANLRTGPSKKHAIKWIIKNKGEPLRVTMKFEQWVKVKDIEGDDGWLLESLVTTAPQKVIISGDKLVLMYKKPDIASKKLARLQKNLRVKIHKCTKDEWCNISIHDQKGWVEQKFIWGI